MAPQQGRKPAASLEEIAHDARNLLAAMGLYADLLAQPGVLNRRYAHYAGHLQVVVDSGMSLVSRLVVTPSETRLEVPLNQTAQALVTGPASSPSSGSRATVPGGLTGELGDLGTAIERRRGMLSLLMGPRVALEIECLPCPGLLRLTPLDLDRVLINLMRNADEAMPDGGRVRISVQQVGGESFLPRTENHPAGSTAAWASPVPGIVPYILHDIVPTLTPTAPPPSSPDGSPEGRLKTVLLCVQDNGPGIDPGSLSRIFDTGFSTKTLPGPNAESGGQPGTAGTVSGSVPSSRGLGLGIVRSLVEAAGGKLRVTSRVGAGTRFEIELPLFPQPASGLQCPSVPIREPKPETVLALSNRQSTRTDEQEGSRVQC